MKSAHAKAVTEISLFDPSPNAAAKLSKRTTTVQKWIEAKRGAEGRAFSPRRNLPPLVVIYEVMGKVFAILSVRGSEDVIVKCDPMLVPVLRKEYIGVGHRSHLDRRFWISVRLDADVPMKEVKRLVSQSYELICNKLTTKQKAELERMVVPPVRGTGAEES